MIKNKANILGWLSLGDGATKIGFSLLNILDSGENIPYDILEIVDFQGYLADCNKKH